MGFCLRRLPFTAVIALGLTLGCATHRIRQNPNTGRLQIQNTFNQYSPQQEVQAGKQAAAEAMKQLPLLPDNNPVTQYVKRLGQRLTAHAPGYKYPYEFHVVNQKEINAFALPGGPVFVNLGTIKAVDNEGELAGVMAHEISHVVLRHATSNASKEQMAQIPLAVLGAVLGNGTGAQLARLGVSLGANGLFLKYSRDAEREADEMGAQIMYDAGYDPYDLVEFFSTLEKQGGSGGPQFLSDHPNPGNREKDVAAVVSKFPKKNYRNDEPPQFEHIKNLVAQMHPMTAQQVAQYQREQQAKVQKATLEQIRPNGSFTTVNGGFFEMQYPSNWKVVEQSQAGATIAPPAAVTQNAVAYGVVVGGMAPQIARGSLETATQTLLRDLQQQNPQIQVQGSKQISVSGLPAITVAMVSPSPITDQSGQPIAEQDTLVTVQRRDGAVVYLVFVAPQNDMGVVGPTYQRMLQSLRVE